MPLVTLSPAALLSGFIATSNRWKKRLKLSLGLHPSSWIVTVLRLAHSFSVLDPSACRSFRRQWRKAREHQDQTIYVTCNLTMDFLQAIESKVNCGG